MPWRDKRNGFLHWIFRRWFPAPSTRGPLPQPQVSPEDARRAKLAEFQSALGITYDVAIIIAGNFPLPGLQSVIGLVDYVKGLRQAKIGNDEALASLTLVIDDMAKALNRAAECIPEDYKIKEPDLDKLTPHLQELMSELVEVSRHLLGGRDRSAFKSYLRSKAIQSDIASARDRISRAQTRYIMLSVTGIERRMMELTTNEHLGKLPIASAAFNESPKSPCLSGTRVKILQGLRYDLTNGTLRVVWLKGSPGVGKSAVAKSLCIELRSEKLPIVSFFFDKDGNKAFTTSAERFASTIARQLARFSPDFSNMLTDLNVDQILRDDSKEQLEQLVIIPANRVKWSSRVVIVLDAVDECGDRQALKELMRLVQRLVQLPPPFTILVSCRPIDIVQNTLKRVPVITKDYSLDDMNAVEDIQIFVRSSLSDIIDESDSGKWPPKVSAMDKFANSCGGLFEIASVRIRQVRDQDSVPLIEIFNYILSYPHDPAPTLLKEYRRILNFAYTHKLMSGEGTPIHEIAYQRYRHFVGVLVTTFKPLTPSSLASLVNMDIYQIRDSLKHLTPVMEIKNDDDPFRFYHASFREFLLSSDKDVVSASFPISFDGAQHLETLRQCLNNFKKSDYGKNMWTNHLDAITTGEAPGALELLRSFLEGDLIIGWLECMSSRDASRHLKAAQKWCEKIEGGVHTARLIKDAISLNFAGDPRAIAIPPRNIRQFRLGWLPATNRFRKKYQQGQITVISIDENELPVQGGLNPFEKKPSSRLPCLTAMSPDGVVFAVANSDGKIDIRQAMNGERCGGILHCEHPHIDHAVVWMYFLDESSLVAEYTCGSIHNHRLDGQASHTDRDTVHSLPLMPSSHIFSACSLDRSTILRLTKPENSGRSHNRDPDTAEGGRRFDGLVVRSSTPLSAYIINCRSWRKPPLALPPINVSKACLLEAGSLAISRNNQYAAVVLIERDGSQYGACRYVHLWSIKKRQYLGVRNIRGPKWESWIPANYFNRYGDDYRFLVRSHDDVTQSGDSFIVDVYHPDDVRLREDDRPQQLSPADQCVFFAVHGGPIPSAHCRTSAVAFTYKLTDVDSQSGEFLYGVNLTNCSALALCIREFIRRLQATCHGFPLDIISSLDQTSVALAHHGAVASHDSALAIAAAARATAVVFAAVGVTHAATTPDIAIVARDIAIAARNVADAAAHRNPSTTIRMIGCSAIFKDKQTFQIPHYLVSSLLDHAYGRTHLHHQSGGSKVVLGGHAHPSDSSKWVPVCVLDLERLPPLKQSAPKRAQSSRVPKAPKSQKSRPSEAAR